MIWNRHSSRAAEEMARQLGDRWEAWLYEPDPKEGGEVPRLVASLPAGRARIVVKPEAGLDRATALVYREGVGVYLYTSPELWDEAADCNGDRLVELVGRWVEDAALEIARSLAHLDAALEQINAVGRYR